MFARANGRKRAQARRAAQIINEHPGLVANEELRILMSTVEDLVDRLGAAADPELKRLRKQAEAALGDAKAVIAQRGARLRDRAGEFAEHGREYVRARPWTSLGLVALGVLVIGVLTRQAFNDE
jgi:ElaB/YqjD/DUF883 family membrane-anchored ribosome-binding protein